jgi:glutathione S-transferase
MFELWIANKQYSSWSLRPWLLLKVLNIPFDENLCEFDPSGDSYNKFKKISPSGKLPCLIYDDTTVWDSLAIIEHIGDIYPDIWPKNRAAKLWSKSAIAEMHSGFMALRSHCPMDCKTVANDFPLNVHVIKDISRISEVWEYGLSVFGGPWLAGKCFSPVDAYFAPVALRAKCYNLPFPSVCDAWIERVLSLPEMREWISQA